MKMAQVHHDVRRVLLKELSILCLLTVSIYAAPTCPSTTDIHKVGFCGPNGYHEWDCMKCPPGLGHSIECGRVYVKMVEADCQPCKNGTYSEKNDFGQCKPCPHCQENEIQTGECLSDHNTLQCKCKHGYYRAQADCKPCSWCCRDKTNEYEDECMNLEKKCSYQDVKSCDPTTTYSPALNSTTSSISISKATTITTKSNVSSQDTTEKRNSDKKWNQYQVLIAVIVSILLILIALVGIFIYCWRKIHRNSSNGDSSQEVSTTSSMNNELSSSAPLMPGAKENEKPAIMEESEKVQIFSKDKVVYVKEEEVPLASAPGNQGEQEDPATGTVTKDDAIESSAVTSSMTTHMETSDMLGDKENHTEMTGEQLSKEQKLDLSVTKLPLKIYRKICTWLDVEDPFFNDYRRFAEELGFSVEKVRALQSDQTNLLLSKCQPKVRKLIEIFPEKIERADVRDLLEEWVNHE